MIRLLDAFYPGDGVTLLVVNVVAQVTAAICVTKLVSHRLLRNSPPARHAAWLACLAFVAVCPLVTFLGDRSGFSLVSVPVSYEDLPTTREDATSHLRPDSAVTPLRSGPAIQPSLLMARTPDEKGNLDPAAQPALGSTTPGATSYNRSGHASPADKRSQDRSGSELASQSLVAQRPGTRLPLPIRACMAALLGVWAIGVALLTVRLLHGAIHVRRLCSQTTPLDETAFADVLARARRTLGRSKLPPIRVCSDMPQ